MHALPPSCIPILRLRALGIVLLHQLRRDMSSKTFIRHRRAGTRSSRHSPASAYSTYLRRLPGRAACRNRSLLHRTRTCDNAAYVNGTSVTGVCRFNRAVFKHVPTTPATLWTMFFYAGCLRMLTTASYLCYSLALCYILIRPHTA